MSKPTIAITIGKKNYNRLIRDKQMEKLESFANVIHHESDEPAKKEDLLKLLPNADAVITSWGVDRIDKEILDAAPNLKALVHMGGSVKRNVCDEMFERGVIVIGASPILAQTVAETTLGMMIMGQKRAGALNRVVRNGGWRESPLWPARELRNKTVGIVGASQVGRHVIKLLEPFNVKIMIYDPYLDEEGAKELKAKKADLMELAKKCDILSLHAPSHPDTDKMINKEVLSVMKDYALIVNSARGELIDQDALIEELKKGRFYAYLDVTAPEPPEADSPLRTLENVEVIPHIAGCIEDCTDMCDRAAEELERVFKGQKPLYQITKKMYDRIS